jgi:uncharacterized protein (TIGR02646 family)
MRSITKGAEPRELIQWKTANSATPQNLFYGGGGFPGEAVRKALLLEQLHLCAYTMKRLATFEKCERGTGDSCHIEHVLPQARNIPSETIDYQNMVACYPPSQTTAACGYGAQAKANYDPANKPFVSPLRTDAAQHFQFWDDGSVEGTTDQGIATVTVLKLDHRALTHDRAAVIRGFLYPRNHTAVSAATARRIAAEVLQPDANRCLHPYCVAIAAAASRHADREERRAARIRGKSRSGRV